MPLKLVTITGADDSVRPEDLVELSKEFPFVEFGILASAFRSGTPRFPSRVWVDCLKSIPTAEKGPLKLSLHLCGKWVRDLLQGVLEFDWKLVPGFDRVQLNFHADETPCTPKKFWDRLLEISQCGLCPGRGVKQIVFQLDGAKGLHHLSQVCEQNGANRGFVDVAPLFDASGGAGVLPEKWPTPFLFREGTTYAFHGYAGGLSPDNLWEQLPKIHEAAHGADYWIDVETHVRSEYPNHIDGLGGRGEFFDLAKVWRFLAVAKNWMEQEPEDRRVFIPANPPQDVYAGVG